MNVKEYSEARGITIAEAKSETGYTHHSNKIDVSYIREHGTADAYIFTCSVMVEDALEADNLLNEVIEVAEELLEDNPELLAEAHALMGGLGTKTKSYLHFVNDNKEQLPEEYKLVLPLIERFLCKK